MLALPAALVALGAAGWLWAGSEGSLDTALRLALRWLPAGQQLQWQGITGTLQEGGRIESLRWSAPGKTLTLQQTHLRWQLAPLLRGRLVINTLDLQDVEWRQDGSAPETPPPQSLELPLTLDAPLRITRLRLPDQAGFEARDIAAHYRYDHLQHTLVLQTLTLAAGRYSGQLQLQGTAPMALTGQLQGQLTLPVPEAVPQAVAATAHWQGTLAGPQAQLALSARLQTGEAPPTPGAAEAAASPTPHSRMSAVLDARLAPWAVQPVLQAQARFGLVDLAALWPHAPRTQLSGSVLTQPPEAGRPWRATVQVDNAQAGPWNHQRLPVRQLQARVLHDGRTWVIEHLQAQAGDGRLDLTGRWSDDPAQGWRAEARVQGINPAALHSAAPPDLLDGQLLAHPSGSETGSETGSATGHAAAIAFDARLQPRAGRARAAYTVQGLPPLRQAQAQGLWQHGRWQVDTLRVELADSVLAGRLDITPAPFAAQGDLTFQAPGTQAEVHGRLTPQEGRGQWQLNVQDASLMARWLARWTAMAASPDTRPAWPTSGQGRLTGTWSGGWAALTTTLTGQPAPARTQPLQIDASLDLPRLAWGPDDWALSDVRARLAGPLTGLAAGTDSIQWSVSGAARQGPRRLQLNLQGSGHAPPPASGRGASTVSMWQARIEQLRLQAEEAPATGPWQLTLPQPVLLQLERNVAQESTEVRLAPGQATLTSPTAGEARLSWQPARWSHRQGHSQWQTAGRIQGIPLAWLEPLAALRDDTSNWGVAGDMVFDGEWDAEVNGAMRLRAELSRQRGDLRLQADELPAGVVATPAQRSAGARQAQLALTVVDQQAQARLVWDSERAGQLQAQLSTQLARSPSGWDWPAQAPIAGRVQASLPRLGVWSVLAPPGWRMRGTLQADVQLSGTRQSPQWQGEISADNLALRSVVEGVELRDGRLRAQLKGRQIDIPEFTLRGARGGGGDGGSLSATGQAQWSGSQFQVQLQAQADHLRVSARADRRLAVSGRVHTRLEQGRLTVRGQLKADQALFILPDETAPSLGKDVVVRTSRRETAAAPPQRPAATSATGPNADGPDVDVTLELGDDFKVQGRGLVTRLTGSLVLRLTPTATEPRVTGDLRTDRGTYKAYGQQLNIEQGLLRFHGPYDNPALDILAVRPQLPTRVGVQISGTVLSPRVRLFSEPEMADADKLAWLVLGRAAASGAAESALLQQAALALLGGTGPGLSEGLARTLGLDEVSFSGVRNTNTGLNSAAVTLGKRLSRDFYLSYERSLTGTLGTFYVFYDLSRRFTLRAQTGEKSAIDLIFTVAYD